MSVERETAEATATREMSDLMRRAVGRQPISTPSASPLAQALSALDAARATGDEMGIDQAERRLDAVLDEGRERAKASAPPPPDFAAGVRQIAPPTPDFNAQLRADRLGWRR